jgi:hypothetical protein
MSEEESCARTRGRRPETMATAAKMEGILIVKNDSNRAAGKLWGGSKALGINADKCGGFFWEL